MSFGTLIGTLTCARCKSQYIKVELINLERSPGVDHVDFKCAVCGAFINHLDVSPHTPDPVIDKLLGEINEELEDDGPT